MTNPARHAGAARGPSGPAPAATIVLPATEPAPINGTPAGNAIEIMTGIPVMYYCPPGAPAAAHSRNSSQPFPVNRGIPWLVFVIFPTYRRLETRKVRHATRCLRGEYRRCRSGERDWAGLRRRIAAWIACARYASGAGVRRAVMSRLSIYRAKG